MELSDRQNDFQDATQSIYRINGHYTKRTALAFTKREFMSTLYEVKEISVSIVRRYVAFEG